MRFALLLYADARAAAATTPDQAMAELARYGELTDDLDQQGVLVGGEAFLPMRDATEVHRVDDRMLEVPVHTTDPELSGFYVVECSRDEAVEIASRLPVATHGHVEIRPVMTWPTDERRSAGPPPESH